MNQPTQTPLSPKIVLGVGAHPDDLDFFAGGTMATFAQQGADIYYLILTDGSRGSDDRTMTTERLRDMRRDEQRTAANILGVKEVFFCDFPDGLLENTPDVKREIVRVIRRVKPDLVITLDPGELYVAEDGLINHPDHRAAGQATLDAVYPLARDHMTFPELLDDGLEPHNTSTVLLTRLNPASATFVVDVEAVLDLKSQALGAHASQFGDLEHIKTWMHELCSRAGKPFGYEFAEPFVRIDVR